ncbi:hypothetical protein SK128_025357 [Halocaridina rubra]|uniref:Uncharacterized protein n=1 Tax=Halocaridina rubra TaxID=373956 RepID=A0AAN8WN29_HALRR
MLPCASVTLHPILTPTTTSGLLSPFLLLFSSLSYRIKPIPALFQEMLTTLWARCGGALTPLLKVNLKSSPTGFLAGQQKNSPSNSRIEQAPTGSPSPPEQLFRISPLQDGKK